MIYLDAAATTLQKPPSVAAASAWAVRMCASPGRGDYAASRRAEEIVFACRNELAELFDTGGAERVVFTSNATHALNLAIRSLVRPGSRVLISSWEHNAVTRTLHSIPNVTILTAEAPLFDDNGTIAAFSAALEQRPDAVVCTCVSNVFGYILPYAAIAALCRAAEVPLILDASQAAGCVPVSLKALGAQFIAFPGHKGMYGPQGTGVLLCGGDADSLCPLLTGGTGSESVRQEMPLYLPDRGEAGTHNVTGIAGLLEGVRFVRRTGQNRILAHERRLLARMEQSLADVNGIQLFTAEGENQAGVLSFVCDGWDCQDLARALGQRGIAVRAGLHCAPMAHSHAGTLDSGTVRVSFSAFNRKEEVEYFQTVLKQIVHGILRGY